MRASFGGAQDLSQQLGFLYEQYRDRLTTLAQQAANREQKDEAATDQDKINAWQSGDLSDKDIIAYLNGRVSDPNLEEDERTQLKEALRNVQDAVAQRQITDSAQSIVDGIENGTRTWDDLLKFYQKQRRNYRPSDPIYKQITDQINQVSDRIRDNEISGGIERAQYLFQSKQVTGKQAGAMIRKFAARYKNEDPAKYYQLLQSASQLEQFGGYYKASGGGGGGGGGSRGAASLNATLDQLQAKRNLLKSLSDQFEQGNTVGQLGGDQYLLRNPDGTPAADMQSADHAMLSVYDQLVEAEYAKGDASAATGYLADKESYITEKIQPRNTIAPEIQRGHMLDAISTAIQFAGDSNDPAAASSRVRSAINGYRAWVEGLNQTKTFNPRNKIEKADVVGDAVGSKVNARENQTTADFVKESASIYDAIEQAVASGNPDAVAGIDLPEGMSDQLRPILQGGAQLAQIVTGLQSGEWAWVSDQNGTHPAPTAFDLQGNRVPVDASGNLINGTKVVVSIGGKPVEAFAQTQQVNVWSGGDVVTNDGTVLVRQGQMVTQADINAVADASKAGRLAAPVDAQNSTMSAESIVVAGEDGKPQLWFGSDGKWWQPMGKDKSVKPLPILAGSDRAASEIAAKMGLDPTAYYTLAKPPEGTQRKGGFQQSVEPGSKPQQQAQPLFPGLNLAPGRGASPLDTGRGAGGTFDAASAVQQFGLNLKPVIKKQGGFFENADLTTKLPGLGSPVNTRRGGFFQGADLTPVQPVAPIRIKPVNLNFDLPEPANIFNPNPTATGRKGGFLK